MKNLCRALLASAAAIVLSACGGGGGNDAPPSPPPRSTATTTSGTLTAVYPVGFTTTLVATFEISDPSVITGDVAVVLDDPQRIVGRVDQIVQTGAFTFQVTAYANPDLPAGVYDGTIRARICADERCNTPYSVATLAVPYHVVVKTVLIGPDPIDVMSRVGHPSVYSQWLSVLVAPSAMTSPVHVQAFDPANVLAGPFTFSAARYPSTSTYENQFRADLTIPSTLAAGTHSGTLQVRLCRDAACTDPYPGLSDTVAYRITVTP